MRGLYVCMYVTEYFYSSCCKELHKGAVLNKYICMLCVYASMICGMWWRIGRVYAFRLEGRRFESHSSPSLTVDCRGLACKLWHRVDCCGHEPFWKAHAERSAIEMFKYYTIQYNTIWFICICMFLCMMYVDGFLLCICVCIYVLVCVWTI